MTNPKPLTAEEIAAKHDLHEPWFTPCAYADIIAAIREGMEQERKACAEELHSFAAEQLAMAKKCRTQDIRAVYENRGDLLNNAAAAIERRGGE